MGRQEDITYTLIVGTIAQMPAEDQEKVQSVAAKYREMMAKDSKPFNDEHAIMAFALVGAEMAKED